MIPTLEDALRLYESLSDADKARVMGRVSWYLTIAARDVCTNGNTEQQRDKLAFINELQHTMLGQQLTYLEGRQQRLSDRDFILTLFRSSKASDLAGHLQYALGKALSVFDPSGDQS
jgi:hypothetical protein